jgi:hypothetical protein
VEEHSDGKVPPPAWWLDWRSLTERSNTRPRVPAIFYSSRESVLRMTFQGPPIQSIADHFAHAHRRILFVDRTNDSAPRAPNFQ